MKKARVHLAPVLVAAFVVAACGIIYIRRTDRTIENLKSIAQDVRLRELEADKAKGEMLQEINNQDDDAYIMEWARNQYGYLLPGEIRFVVSNAESMSETPEATIVEEGQ